MELSAPDIRNRSFSKGLRGLDADEVYAFLGDVADRWAEMTNRIEALETKLTEIGDAADKAQTAKERAEALKAELRTREQRLDEKEQDLEERRAQLDQKAAKLRSIAERLQATLQEESRALSALTEGAAPSNEPDEASDDKSTEEWVDSLFPNRLPDDESPAGEAPTGRSTDEPAEEDLSASESQFEAIKQDVQGMQEDDRADASAASTDDEENDPPPTKEMDQIWDVFDEPK